MSLSALVFAATIVSGDGDGSFPRYNPLNPSSAACQPQVRTIALDRLVQMKFSDQRRPVVVENDGEMVRILVFLDAPNCGEEA